MLKSQDKDHLTVWSEDSSAPGMSRSWCVGDAKSFSVVPTFTRPELAWWILYCIISEGMSAVSPSLSIETTWPGNEASHQTQPVSHYTTSTHNRRHTPVVVYGCETWSLSLREEQRLRIFENRMLIKISGPKREEKTGWGKTAYWGDSWFVSLTKHYPDDQLTEDESGRACGTYRGEEETWRKDTTCKTKM